eukprot:7545687-Pyramimonas_sp.AAC.1
MGSIHRCAEVSSRTLPYHTQRASPSARPIKPRFLVQTRDGTSRTLKARIRMQTDTVAFSHARQGAAATIATASNAVCPRDLPLSQCASLGLFLRPYARILKIVAIHSVTTAAEMRE